MAGGTEQDLTGREDAKPGDGDRAAAAERIGVGPTGRRTRIVLARVARPGIGRGGLHAELTEQTNIGEALVKGLVRAQLALALRLALVVGIGLGALPLLFAIAPDVAQARIFGIGLPWLLLGVASFPFLMLVGWAYVRLAERNEQDFTDLVRRPER